MLDPKLNFSITEIKVNINATDTEIELIAGGVDRLPDGEFNIIIFNSTDYNNSSEDPEREICRVTGKAGNKITVERGQEDTVAVTHNLNNKTYKVFAGWTKKDVDDINAELAQKASLDASGKVPASQLPTYVSDLEEYTNRAAFPDPGISGKIYVSLDNNHIWRWSGTIYIDLTDSLQSAVDTDTDTTNFNKRLSPTDSNVQKALETLDDYEDDTIIQQTIIPTDDWQSKCLVDIKEGLDFFGDEQVVIGEFAVPNECKDNSNGELSKWLNLGAILMKYFNSRNTRVAWWAFGHEGDDKYTCNVFAKNKATGIWMGKATSGMYAEAIQGAVEVWHNYAGNEFYVNMTATPPEWGAGLPDSAPTEADFQVYKNKGVDVIRYPIGEPANEDPEGAGNGGDPHPWLANATTKVIDPDFIGHIERVLNRSQAVKTKVALDVLHPADGAEYGSIHGNSLKTTTGLDDYKSYVQSLCEHTFDDNNGTSVELMNHPALKGLMLINEPHSGGVGALSASDTESITQNIATWLQDTVGFPTSKTIYVPTHEWSGLQSVTTYHANPWITGITNYAYDCHFYPLPTHNDGWATENVYNDNAYANAEAGASAYHGQGEFTIGTGTVGISDDKIASGAKRAIPALTADEIIQGTDEEQKFANAKEINDAIESLSSGGTTQIQDIQVLPPAFADDGGASTTEQSVSVSTVGSDLLLVKISCRQISEVSSVTFGGVAMTEIATRNNYNMCGVAWYKLENPTEQTADVSVVLGDIGRYISVTAIPLKNAGDVAFAGSNDDDSDSATVSAITTKDRAVIFGGLECKDDTVATRISGEATIHNSAHAAAEAGREASAYYRQNVAGTFNFGWNLDSTDFWAVVAIIVSPKTEAIITSNDVSLKEPSSDALVFDGTEIATIPNDEDYSITKTGELSIYIKLRMTKLDFDQVEASSDNYVNMPVGKIDIAGTRRFEYGFRFGQKTSPHSQRVNFYVYEPDGGFGSGAYIEVPYKVGEELKYVATVKKDDADPHKGNIWLYDARRKGGDLTEFPRSTGSMDSDDCLGAHQDLDEYPDVPTNMSNTSAPVVFGHMDDSSGQNCTTHCDLMEVAFWNRELSADEVFEQVFLGIIPNNGLLSYFPLKQVPYDQEGANDKTDIPSLAGFKKSVATMSGKAIFRSLVGEGAGVIFDTRQLIGSERATGSNETSQEVDRAWLREVEVSKTITITEMSLAVYDSVGSIDIGIYNKAGTLLGSTGSTACPATGAGTISLQSPVELTQGVYYIAIACDSSTASFRTDATILLAGGYLVNNNFPLANLAGNVDAETATTARAFSIIGK